MNKKLIINDKFKDIYISVLKTKEHYPIYWGDIMLVWKDNANIWWKYTGSGKFYGWESVEREDK